MFLTHRHLTAGTILTALRRCTSSKLAAAIAALAMLAASSGCTPEHDWRDVRGTAAPFTVLLPSKPSIHSRPVNLGGIQTTMTMTAAEVADVTFAVATAELPDAAQAQAALLVMKDTMVKNIDGVVRKETAQTGSTAPGIEIEAGPAAGAAGKGDTLRARFFARGRQVYQVVVLGRGKPSPQEAADTFLTSFKIE